MERKRKVRFERNASRIAFDAGSSSFVVTWSKCGRSAEERLAAKRGPENWIPSVSAVTTLYDRGCIPHEQIVYAARAVGKAWSEGDREFLDTDGAKKAAELVADLSSMCVDPSSPVVASDLGQAMRHLLDEIAAVRFADAPAADFEEGAVMPSLEKAAGECLANREFLSWPKASMRKRFLYCLGRKERTDVVYTLVALLFDCGSCPLLSLTDRRALRMRAPRGQFDRDGAMSFARFALSRMREAKSEGRSRIKDRMTAQQLTDMLSADSC